MMKNNFNTSSGVYKAKTFGTIHLNIFVETTLSVSYHKISIG